MMELTTEQLIRNWNSAKERLNSARSELNSAEVNLRNAVNELGKRLAPKDAKAKEDFCIWTRLNHEREVLIIVTTLDDIRSNFTISIRK